MMAGWDALDLAIAVWAVVGFFTFMAAGMVQMSRIDKQTTEAIGKVLKKEESVFSAFAPGKIGVEIDGSNSGMVAGTGFVMAASGVAALAIKAGMESHNGTELLGGFLFSAASLYAFFYLVRAVTARATKKAK